jgi:hypothetical protein
MTTPDDVSANDIPDILAGTLGTEQAAIEHDPDAVVAALRQDPNLLEEVLQPGFVELVNELAGDAAPTLGQVESVGQSYEDANNQTMGDAFSDLQAQQQQEVELNPQPLPPSPIDQIEQLEHQLEVLEDQLANQPTQEFSSYENQEAEPFSQDDGNTGFAGPAGGEPELY